jgi:hypothetical protein
MMLQADQMPATAPMMVCPTDARFSSLPPPGPPAPGYVVIALENSEDRRKGVLIEARSYKRFWQTRPGCVQSMPDPRE